MATDAPRAMAALPAVETEKQARLCGRRFAKQIFQPMQWKRVQPCPSETHASGSESADVELFESLSASELCVRAVRRLPGTIAQIEAALALMVATDKSCLLAKLLPSVCSSGGIVKDFGPLQHTTGEREHVNLQHASLRPYHSNSAGSSENHVLLAYTLSTRLQLSLNDMDETDEEAEPVASVLHLLRPVRCPSFGLEHREFQHGELSTNEFSVTYIIQDVSRNGQEEVSLEVLLTCSRDLESMEEPLGSPYQRASEIKSVQSSTKSRSRGSLTLEQKLWKDVMGLTRIRQSAKRSTSKKVERPATSRHSERLPEPIVCTAPKPERSTVTLLPSAIPGEPTPSSSTSRSTITLSSMPASDSNCTICRKRFGAFRWKRSCEVCKLLACNRCLSMIANPAAVRKKRRVCNRCLYGTHGVVNSQPTAQAMEISMATADQATRSKAAEPATHVVPSTAVEVQTKQEAQPTKPVLTEEPKKTNDSELLSDKEPEDESFTSLLAQARNFPRKNGVAPSRRYSAPQPKSFGKRPRQRAPAPLPPSASALDRARHAVMEDYHSDYQSDYQSDWTDSEMSEDEDAIPATLRSRARRAQTVTILDVPFKTVSQSTRSFGIAPTYRSSYSDFSRVTLASVHETEDLDIRDTDSAASLRTKLSLHHLETQEPDYELDFDWLNIFPKAPTTNSHELDRSIFLSSLLKLDPQSVVFLRHDAMLDHYAHRVLDVASQWHGCSINIVCDEQVFCLVNASSDMDADTSEWPVVVAEDCLPREESASAYAVYYNAPFFVREMEADDRFRAHPLHTDHETVSFLSFPLYAQEADVAFLEDSPPARRCIGTLDLWKLDHVPATSHVSHEWWKSMNHLRKEIGARLQRLAHESQHFQLKTKANSVGSASDSRGSTWRDSTLELDLYDLDLDGSVSESGSSAALKSGSPNFSEPLGASRSKRSVSMTEDYSSPDVGMNDDIPRRYSGLDFKSTIESLLEQANKTSNIIHQSVTV